MKKRLQSSMQTRQTLSALIESRLWTPYARSGAGGLGIYGERN